MADSRQYVIQLTVDDKGAVSNVNELNNSIQEVDKSTTSLRKQLRDIQAQLSGLDVNSDEFQKLSKQAGELKDRMNDAAEAVRANAGNAFEGLANNAGLLGDRLLSLDFEGVASSAKGLAANLKNVSAKEITQGVSQMGSAFLSLGKALLANPIFLIGGAIAAVVLNIEKLLPLIDGVTDAQEEQLELTKEKVALEKEGLDAISRTENTLKLSGKSEKEIRDLKIQQLNAVIAATEAQLAQQKAIKQAQVEAANRNKDILTGILNFLTAPFQVLLGGVDQLISGLNKVGIISDETFASIGSIQQKFKDFAIGGAANLLFDPAEVEAEGAAAEKAIQTELENLKNQRDGFLLDQKNKDAQAAKERAEARKKEADEMLRAQQEVSDLMQKLLAEQEAEEAESQRRRLDALVKANEERIKEEDAQFALRQSLIEDQTEREIDAIVAKYDALFAAAEGNAELERQLAQAQANELQAIRDKATEEEIANQQRVAEARISLASDGINALAAINDSFTAKNESQARRQFNINKGLQIAQALIQTYQSATGAYASQLTIPSPDAPIRAAIAAGAAVAAGLAQVNKIRQTQFSSSGGGGGGGGASVPSFGGGGGGAGSTPQFNPINTNFITNRPDQITPAYVLAGDVANATEARTKVEDLSRL
jgi:hypothetical protein